MVWCNALTEYYNTKNDTIYECVYKKNNGEVIRSSTDANADVCDSVVPDTEADGFRLLSVDEWELAARYKDDGDIKDKGEYYPVILPVVLQRTTMILRHVVEFHGSIQIVIAILMI